MPVPVPAPLLDGDGGAGSGDGGRGAHRGARPPRPERESGSERSFLRELPILIGVAVVLAVVIKTFLLQAFFIPSGSMENTLLVGDRVLVNKLVYDFRDPHRGEIVVFNGTKSCAGTPAGPPAKACAWPEVPASETASSPATGVSGLLRKIQSFVGLGSSGDHDFIKRVIAIGGDTVSCPPTSDNPSYCDKVVVDGVPLQETGYVFEDNHAVFAPVKVPKGDLWVMGDHRGDSSDSRYNGTIAVSSVVGRAFVTVWPIGRFGGHEVPQDFNQKFPQQAAGTAALPPVAGLVGALPLTWVSRRVRARRRRASR
jgi:signal peptidase I